MLKLSRNLLDYMDRFVIDRSSQTRQRREPPVPPSRRSTSAPESRDKDYEYAEVSRS
jgi:hypothetical protein